MTKTDALPTANGHPAGSGPLAATPPAAPGPKSLGGQRFGPDEFFTAAQIQRLHELMAEYRAALNRGEDLPAEQAAELDSLIDAELEGAMARTVHTLNHRGS